MDAHEPRDELGGMDIHLPADLSQFVHEEVRRGEYASPEDVVRDAIERLAEDARTREDIREKIALGLAQLRNGEGIDGDVVAARMRARIAEHRKNGL